MNRIKKGVKLYGSRPEIIDVHGYVKEIFNKHEYDCILTSAMRERDGKSFHGEGLARDYGTKHIAPIHVKNMIIEEIKETLPMCDVILERKGRKNEHLHVEFDPKDDLGFQKDKAFFKKSGYWPI